MGKSVEIAAVIPVRGGSKGIPRKTTRTLSRVGILA